MLLLLLPLLGYPTTTFAPPALRVLLLVLLLLLLLLEPPPIPEGEFRTCGGVGGLDSTTLLDLGWVPDVDDDDVCKMASVCSMSRIWSSDILSRRTEFPSPS